MFKKITTRQIVLCGMFIALDVVFSRFIVIPISSSQRISLQFIAHAVCGYYMGPIPSAIAMMASDVVGFLINSNGYSFFPGYLLSAAISGIIYGLFLHGKPVKFLRTVVSVSLVTLVVTFFINNYWTSIFMSTRFWTVAITKLPVTALYWPAACIITYIVLMAISKIKILNSEK